MKTYLLDTNVVVAMVRYPKFTAHFEENYSKDADRFISVVVEGEIKSLAIQWNWGEAKLQRMNIVLSTFIILPIKIDSIIHAYAQIDAFSQGKLLDKPLPTGLSARNMGKNDLWIAATAHATSATLLTTDTDFDHLHNAFLDLDRIDIQPYL